MAAACYNSAIQPSSVKTLWVSSQRVCAGYGAFEALVVASPLDVANSVWTLRDERVAGTQGGSMICTPAAIGDPFTWLKRTLTVAVGEGPWLKFNASTSQFTLFPGVYCISARAPAYRVNAHKIRLFNVTTGKTAAWGSNAYSNETNFDMSDSALNDIVTVSNTSQTFQIEHVGQNPVAVDGMGVAAQDGIFFVGDAPEIYTTVNVKLLRSGN